MEFNFQGLISEMEHNQMEHTTPYFSDHSIQDGLRSGRTSLGGGHGGVEVLRGSMQTIQRRIEKERIREEILAEDAARRRVLEEEVRREIMFEKYNGGGSFFVGTPVSRNTLLEPAMQPIQPFSMAERYGGGGGGGHQRREIREFEAVPFQRPLWSPGDGKQKVVDLGRLNDSASHEPPPLPAAAGSSQVKHCSGEIGLGVAPNKSIKNSNKLVSKKEDNKSGFSYWCTMCGVGASSETVMKQHKEGKKHLKNLEKGGHGNLGVRKKTKRKQKSHKAARHRGINRFFR